MIKRLGARAFDVAPAGRVGKRYDAGLRLGTSDSRPLIPSGHGAHDIGLHDDVGRAADHQEMLDVVAAHQHEPSAPVHGGGVDHRQTGHPAAIGVGAQPVAGESANQPGGDADQRQYRHKGEEKCKCLHAVSPANGVFFKFLFVERGLEATPRTANEALSLARTLNSPRQKLPPPYLNNP
jgi:hypothetical protein